MSIDAGQLIAISLIGFALALGIGLLYGLVCLARWTWAWVVGAHPQPQKQQGPSPQPERSPRVAHAAPITASDLHVIRSNLDAVSRQVEDLERRLRLSEGSETKIINLQRR
jgi:hypothetical protein